MFPKKLLNTLSGNANDIPPIWFMRQAGRYLKEYKAVRETTSSFLEFCYTPDKATEVTLQPIKRFDFDASIIFSDILVIPDALGMDVQFHKGEGPVLKALDPEQGTGGLVYDANHLAAVYEAIKQTRKSLPHETTLIGFAGAPWTLATYMIEGKSSKEHQDTRRVIYEHPHFFESLIDILVDAVSTHLIAQIDAGAEVVQIFDSWAGSLNNEEFERFSIAPTKQIVKNIKAVYPHVPVIGFPRKASLMYVPYAQQTGVDALGFDQFINPEWIRDHIDIPVQGNLDPLLLATDIDRAITQATALKTCFKGQPYIFNLGHGILPFTPVKHVETLLTCIRES